MTSDSSFADEGLSLGEERFDETDIARISAALMRDPQASWREPGEPLNLGAGIRWRPRLVSEEGGKICHIQVTPVVGRAWLKRMEAAAKAGYQVSVAAPLQYWYAVEILTDLDELGVRVIVLENSTGEWGVTGMYRTVPELIAMSQLVLKPDIFVGIATRALHRALTAVDNHEKGWRYEDFLCLLFSQTSFFDVFARNYRNATQEIDLVLHDRRVGEAPVVLVSAKNMAEPIGKDALASLRSKMSGRRGQCKLGFLCTSRTFAGTVRLEEMGYRLADSVVVLVDESITSHLLGNAEDLDKEFERLIIDAALA